MSLEDSDNCYRIYRSVSFSFLLKMFAETQIKTITIYISGL